MEKDLIRGGDALTWEHVPRGGYGYVHPVHVTVIAVGRVRVRVEAPLQRGGTKLVWVTPEALRPRTVRA